MGQERHTPELRVSAWCTVFGYVQAQKKRHIRRHAASEGIS